MKETHQKPVLSVANLCTEFVSGDRRTRVVNDVSFDVHQGETVSIVGESGSGKSMTLMSILRLLPAEAHVVRGHARFGDIDLIGASARQLRRVRGGEIGLIFQDPMTALNPVMTIGQQIDESLKRHSPDLGRRPRRQRVIELLDRVRIPHATRRVDQYPHEFSGGMRQRAMIAMAMANRPWLLLADEPTTALDVTVQAQILALLGELQSEFGMALVLITHDLGVVAEAAHRAVVMYAGSVVEAGTVEQLFDTPRHPYTRGLLGSRPRLEDVSHAELLAIPGQPPSPAWLPQGCAFRPRCIQSRGRAECKHAPSLVEVGPGHAAACHFHAELALATPGLEAR